MKYFENGGFYEEQNENLSRIEITDAYWQQLLSWQSDGKEIYADEHGYPMIRDPIISKANEISSRIEYLKEQLSSTDYEAIKYAEGELSAEDYEPLKEQRRAWRAEINTLEA